MKSILNFKDKINRTMVINGNRFAAKQAPIMSFQTSKNGTFNPSIETSTGNTLKWVVDGVEYITNTLSVELTGDVVDVQVYANNFQEGDQISDVNFSGQNIIGELDFSYFALRGNFYAHTNAGLTNVRYSTDNIVSNLYLYSTGLIGVLNLSTVVFNGYFYVHNCPSLTNITFSSSLSTPILVRAYSNSFTGTLDFSTVKCTNYDISNNSNLTDLVMYEDNTLKSLTAINCGFTSLNFSNTRMASVNVQNNTSLSAMTFSNLDNSGAITISGCSSLLTLDLSNYQLSYLAANTVSSLSSITFKNAPQTLSLCSITNTQISSLDLSNFTVTAFYCYFYNNPNLSSVSMPTITANMQLIRGYNCALSQASVDSIFSYLNTFFSSTTPIKSLDVQLNGGTNASPTGGANNADILNLISIYNAAGFTFTYTIN